MCFAPCKLLRARADQGQADPLEIDGPRLKRLPGPIGLRGIDALADRRDGNPHITQLEDITVIALLPHPEPGMGLEAVRPGQLEMAQCLEDPFSPIVGGMIVGRGQDIDPGPGNGKHPLRACRKVEGPVGRDKIIPIGDHGFQIGKGGICLKERCQPGGKLCPGNDLSVPDGARGR
jgi:hypothetical protein